MGVAAEGGKADNPLPKLGLVLVAIGLLSLVLPLFGRQFILVSLFSVFGLGAHGTASVFIGLGVLLIFAGVLGRSRPR